MPTTPRRPFSRLTLRRYGFLATVFLTAVGLPIVAVAGQSAQSWFARMQHTVGRQSYQGTVVYLNGGPPMAYRLIVCASGYSRLMALSGPAREIIRGPRVAVRRRANGATMVVHGTPGDASAQPFPPATKTPATALTKAYRFQLGAWSRVAGERARLIELIPRDHWRYGYRVWVGGKSGLPLRSQLVNNNGVVLEQAFFTQLKLVTDDTAKEEIGNKALALVEHANAPSLAGKGRHCPGKGEPGNVNLRGVPTGFHQVSLSCEQAPDSTKPVTHILLSDGLASVSVFVAQHADNGSTLVGGTQIGSVHAVGRIEHGYAVTAMGAVPLATVADIANGVQISHH